MASTSTDAAPAATLAAGTGALFRAVEGVRNGRAIAALLGCLVAGIVVAALLASLSTTLGALAGLLGALVYLVAVGTGVNAAGILQMDDALGRAPRSTVDALVGGLVALPRLLVIGLAFFAIELIVFVVIAVALFLCKLPFLGPLLFAIVLPISVVVAGLTVVGLAVALVLALPALWQGDGVTEALGRMLAIVRSRFVEAVLLLFVVGVLAFAVGLVVFGVLASGLVPTLAMSAGIVGFGGFGNLGASTIGAMSPMLAGGHALAGAIGVLVLWAAGGALVGQVWLRGLSLVYLRVVEGLDADAPEATLRAAIDAARQRAGAIGDRVAAATSASRSQRAGDTASTSDRRGTPDLAPTAGGPSGPGMTSTTGEPGRHGEAASSSSRAAAADAPSTTRAQPPVDAWSGTDVPGPVAADPSRDERSFADMQSAAFGGVAPARTATTAKTATCPQCLSTVDAADAFCGVCGYRLQ